MTVNLLLVNNSLFVQKLFEDRRSNYRLVFTIHYRNKVGVFHFGQQLKLRYEYTECRPPEIDSFVTYRSLFLLLWFLSDLFDLLVI